MAPPLRPRDYQIDADEALWRFVHAHPDKNPLVVLPTGTGKSLQIAMFMWRLLASYPRCRVMMATHVKELIEGNYQTLLRLWPAAPAGVYSSGLGSKNLSSQLTFAGIQSIVRAAGLPRFDFLLIDEAHLVSPKDNASYKKLIAKLRGINPNLIVIGFTATPFRMGMGSLLNDTGMFDAIAFDGGSGPAFVWFIENGYLVRLVPVNPGIQLNSDAISLQAGEFNNQEAHDAFIEQDIYERAIKQTIKIGEEQGRRCWLTFCQSIEDAELCADIYRFNGYPVEAVHSNTPNRDDILAKLKRGELRGVTNRDILTTGFDHPPIDLICMLRLTRSPGLWVQMLGRGTRPVYAPGYDLNTLEGRRNAILAGPKQTCLVLDYVGNTLRLGPINYPNLPAPRGKGGGTPPVRECPDCSAFVHISILTCPECGYEFPPPEPESKIKDRASSQELVLDMALQPEPRKIEVLPVHRMIAAVNAGKKGKLDTLRVDYFSGFQRFSTWVCFEHPADSFPRRKAEEWWRDHGGQGPAPRSVEAALDALPTLRKPKFLKVWTNRDYPEIQGYDFRGTRFELPPEAGGPPLEEPGPDPAQQYHQALQPPKFEGYFDDDIPF